MKRRILCIILTCFITPIALTPKEHPSIASQQEPLTADRAFAALRAGASGPGSSLQVIREITSNGGTREVARRALEEATSHHIGVYPGGILLAVLKTGGFLISEFDPTTGSAISLHLVSSGPDERTIIESHKIEGTINADLVKELIENTEDLVDVLLKIPLSEMSELESGFDGGRFPQYSDPGEESYFAIPSAVGKISTDPSEKRELTALFGAFHFWPMRYAITMRVYAANPDAAVRMAAEKREGLIQQFMLTDAESSDSRSDPQDLEAIRTPEQFRERISWFRRVDHSLEEAIEAEKVSPDYDICRSLSTIALWLGSTSTAEGDLFSVMTSNGIIVEWKQLSKGKFAVKIISMGE